MKTLNLHDMENVHGGDGFLGIPSCAWAIGGTMAVTVVAAFIFTPAAGFLVGKFFGTVGVITSCGDYS